jgi:hypothetical protein
VYRHAAKEILTGIRNESTNRARELIWRGPIIIFLTISIITALIYFVGWRLESLVISAVIAVTGTVFAAKSIFIGIAMLAGNALVSRVAGHADAGKPTDKNPSKPKP